eukprot:CAMPEP_0203766186 /NCGR_PEP_ID=MMETSP0099_2-20121227/273_1 /ASSEMBLY_ACC=CAM_ASM_000209 /TAXON_ID=96639 /ORGANISM=" , Strain NY0313808BC1" /LENGTH=459 /DNA_ID=CAMNT_0050662499 /DNA_START=229 /DNA_END=1604 /DNA_ORIENTATION=-
MGLFSFETLRRGEVQLCIAGFAICVGSGFFNALNGLGGAGSSNPEAADMGNFVLNLVFAFSAYLSGAFFNMLGPRVLLTVAPTGYMVYEIFSYYSGKPNPPSWGGTMFLISTAYLGWLAGWLWTAQGAIMLAYAPERKRSKYIGYTWAIFNLFAVTGGLLTFALNFNSTSGNAGAGIYYTFACATAVGVVVSFFGIVKPESVIRSDGEHVVVPPQHGFRESITGTLKALTETNMLFLAPIFFSSNFFYAYGFNKVNGSWCSVRGRGLNDSFFWASQVLGGVIFGKYMDAGSRSKASRAKIGFIATFVACIVAWTVAVFVEFVYIPGRKDIDTNPLDINEAGFYLISFELVLLGMTDCLIQLLSYWLMSTLARSDSTKSAQYTGVYKGWQNIGNFLSWFLGVPKYAGWTGKQYCLICVAVLLVGFIFAVKPVLDISKIDDEDNEKVSNEKDVENLGKVQV